MNSASKNNFSFPVEFTTFSLHILAMFLMLLDHMWGVLYLGEPFVWMTCLGRIAFPIFSFLIVEGYFHTSNFKKYALRLLVGALLSEIPFDLMHEGVPFYLFHQNVILLFLIALLGIYLMEKVRTKGKLWLTILADLGIVLGTFLLGTLTFADYYGPGVLTVYLFYFFRGRKWWCFLGQVLVMYWLNFDIMGGRLYNITLFGTTFEVLQQGFAILALIPIWLYRGKQGYHSKPFQYFCYAFYPVHALILYLIAYVLLPLFARF